MFRRRQTDQDFSDRLNPILVKELKQTVRSPWFVVVFALVQLVMILSVAYGQTTAASAVDIQQLSIAFWAVVGVYLLGILPLAGFNAIASEYRDGRMDLLQITHLSPRNIIVGKWLSLNIQGWLIVLSLLPYITLRYFLGSVNPLHELITLGLILYGSLIASSVTVYASTGRTKLGRIFMFLSAGFVLLLLSSVLLAAASDPVALGFFIILLQVPFTFMLFEVATAQLLNEPYEHHTYSIVNAQNT